jgi:hypothetical protein
MLKLSIFGSSVKSVMGTECWSSIPRLLLAVSELARCDVEHSAQPLAMRMK